MRAWGRALRWQAKPLDVFVAIVVLEGALLVLSSEKASPAP
jgi:hypothetical protein